MLEQGAEELISRASQGDGQAVELLLERYLPELQKYVRTHAGRLVRSRESSSDLVQSVCRELLERLDGDRFQYQGERAFRKWLYKAAMLKIMSRNRYWRADKRDAERDRFPSRLCPRFLR